MLIRSHSSVLLFTFDILLSIDLVLCAKSSEVLWLSSGVRFLVGLADVCSWCDSYGFHIAAYMARTLVFMPNAMGAWMHDKTHKCANFVFLLCNSIQLPRWRSRQRVSLIISRSWVRSSLGAKVALIFLFNLTYCYNWPDIMCKVKEDDLVKNMCYHFKQFIFSKI